MDRIIDNYFNLQVMAGAFPDVLKGFGVTILVTLLVIAFGISVGLGLALLRSLRIRLVDLLIVIYIDAFRTLPQLVVIIVIYFGLPYAGLSLSPFVTMVFALGAILSAFAAEIFWSAIMAVPPGQSDAAKALGLSRLKTMALVILPQAGRLALPMLTNRAIAIGKGTALGTAVALPETLGQAQSVMAIVANPSPLTLAAMFYLALFIPLVAASRVIERRFGPGH
jgi:His/Glu/Gln/Arg/opine family amino acid ABC transporter permease subunit